MLRRSHDVLPLIFWYRRKYTLNINILYPKYTQTLQYGNYQIMIYGRLSITICGQACPMGKGQFLNPYLKIELPTRTSFDAVIVFLL